MILNPTVANLHNLKTDRYHPIVFREAPQPSYRTGDMLVRSKSTGHHTDGFDTREEAIVECKKIVKVLQDSDDTIFTDDIEIVKLCISRDFAWDGEDTPVMISFFGENENGEIVPVM